MGQKRRNEREVPKRRRDEVKWTPQAVLGEACQCPSEDNKFQDPEMCEEGCSGESEVAARELTASLPAQEVR